MESGNSAITKDAKLKDEANHGNHVKLHPSNLVMDIESKVWYGHIGVSNDNQRILLCWGF